MANGKALLASATVLMVGLVLAGTNPGDKATKARAQQTRQAARRLEAGGGPAKRGDEAPAVAAIGWGENAVPTVKPGEAAADAPRVGDNNNCNMALPIPCNGTRDIVFAGTWVGDSTLSDPNFSCNCDLSNCYPTGNSVWLKYVPQPGVHEALIDVCQSDAPLPATCLGVYRPDPNYLDSNNPQFCRHLIELACNLRAGCGASGVCCGTSAYTGCNSYYDPPTGGDCSGGASRLMAWNLQPGQTYYIRVSILPWQLSGGQWLCMGTYRVGVNAGWTPGACCIPGSGCCVLHEAECAGSGGTWHCGLCDPGPCEPNCPCDPNAFAEREYAPGDLGLHINDGCFGTGVLPAFAAIRCNEAICGSSWYFDATNHDEDWYKLVVPGTSNVKLDWYAKAHFKASLKILKPGTDPNNPCTGYTVVAQNDPNAFVTCNTDPNAIASHAIIASTPPGEYWLTIAPAVETPPGYIYSAKVMETACTVATGACCDSTNPSSPTCSLTTAAACTGAARHYWGDGTTCPPEYGCWVCPAGANISPEGVCSDGWSDTYDSGCAAGDTPLVPNELVCNTAWCGTSGTFVTSGTNARDNDWYFVDLTYNSLNPIWLDPTGTSCEARKIDISVYAEFDAEVLIWNLLTPQNPCAGTVDTSVDVFAKAGESIEFSFCKTKVADPSHPWGDFFVVVRPAYRGTSREYPCGSRYWLYMSCAGDCDVGACCTPTGCVAAQTYAECCALGGSWFGQGTVCADFFCTCDTGTFMIPENEPNCGQPTDTVDGGCNYTPNKFITLPSCGAGVCGTISVWTDPNNDIWRDLDWYLYHHTTGDLALYVGAQFDGVVYISGPLVDPCTPCPAPGGYSATFTAGSSGVIYLPAAQATPGWWELIVTAPFDPALPCTGGNTYEMIVMSGLPGACCGLGPGTCCIETYAAICTDFGATFAGEGRTCMPNPCTGLGVCCLAGACSLTTQAGCQPPGVWHCEWTSCSPNNCPPPTGACCTPAGTCTVIAQANCTAPDSWLGEWTTCSPNPCPQLGACCTLTGGCTLTLQLNCLTPNLWLGAGTNCMDCPWSGACCTPAGGCSIAFHANCQPPDIWHGEWWTCTPNPCLQPTGACCSTAGTCSVIIEAACVIAGGHYYGDNTTCRIGNKCPPSCNGDMNCNGRVTFADIDLFVAALSGESAWPHWPCPWLNADCNGDGIVTFADIDCFVGRIGTTCP